MNPTVLIAGGGPTGLVAALALCKLRVPVRIIDKRTTLVDHPKGAGIHPRTLELHHILGTLPDILQRARHVPLKCFYGPDGRTPALLKATAEIRDPTPDIPWPNGLFLWQSAQEEILRNHLKQHGVEVEWGTELKSFKDSQDQVSVQLESPKQASCQYLIGAEGAHSIVRKTLGLSFLGEATKERLVVGSVQVKNLLQRWHIWGSPQKQLVSLAYNPDPKAQPNSFSLTIVGTEIDERFTGSRDDIVSAFTELSGRSDIEFGEYAWTSMFLPHVRMVDRFSKGRCFVVGDSAHVHTPAGGQGLNSGFQDAMNIAWKLAAVIKTEASPSLLETYTTERLPVIAAMLDKTKLILNATLKDDVRDEKSIAWRRDGELTMLGINYRGSNIIVDTVHPADVQAAVNPYRGGESLCAGDRAPQAPGVVDRNGGGTSLFDIFEYGQHTLLIFSDSITDEVTSLVSWASTRGTVKAVIILPKDSAAFEDVDGALVLQDSDGHASRAYFGGEGVEGMTVVAVRPDMYIGAMVKKVDEVKDYFGKIFLG
ncbi:FAD binding domain-containing protein [Flagelloscypha sp. PMI_526]|nr:FAD binding domain-containing protein [Flagelloscypha sp. PMI_526]